MPSLEVYSPCLYDVEAELDGQFLDISGMITRINWVIAWRSENSRLFGSFIFTHTTNEAWDYFDSWYREGGYRNIRISCPKNEVGALIVSGDWLLKSLGSALDAGQKNTPLEIHFECHLPSNVNMHIQA